MYHYNIIIMTVLMDLEKLTFKFYNDGNIDVNETCAVNSIVDREKFKRQLVSHNWRYIYILGGWELNTSIMSIAVKSDWRALEKCSFYTQNEQMCMDALDKDWRAIMYINNAYKSIDVCKKAIIKDWRAISCIGDKYRTVTELVYQINWKAIMVINNTERRKQIISNAINDTSKMYNIIHKDKGLPVISSKQSYAF